LLVGKVHAKPPSHTGDSVAEQILVVALPRRRWLWRDITVKSC
jgi:hypothetical protein